MSTYATGVSLYHLASKLSIYADILYITFPLIYRWMLALMALYISVFTRLCPTLDLDRSSVPYSWTKHWKMKYNIFSLVVIDWVTVVLNHSLNIFLLDSNLLESLFFNLKLYWEKKNKSIQVEMKMLQLVHHLLLVNISYKIKITTWDECCALYGIMCKKA